MADVNRGDRPLSPHLSIYRLELTLITSILVRITGNALLFTALLIVWWFLAAAMSPDAFATANGVLTGWFGDIVMTLSLLGIWYHTLAGVRHLIWDTGSMLEIDRAEMLGWICLAGSVVLTILTIIIV